MTEQTRPNDDVEAARTLDERAGTEAHSVHAHEDRAYDRGAGLEEQLEQARTEADEMRDKFLRARADMDNFRKRMERSYAEQSRSQTKSLLAKLLSVKDNLERALQFGNGAQNGESIIEGVRLTLYQLDNLLEQEGVKVIEAEGRPFDPRLEEAVHSVQDPEVEDQTVVRVVRRGYTYRDEVLRPAQVVVSVRQ